MSLLNSIMREVDSYLKHAPPPPPAEDELNPRDLWLKMARPDQLPPPWRVVHVADSGRARLGQNPHGRRDAGAMDAGTTGRTRGAGGPDGCRCP